MWQESASESVLIPFGFFWFSAEIALEIGTDRVMFNAGNGEVDFEEFCEMMAKKIAEQGDVDIERDLQDVFKLFDKNNRG